ncbi:hypothetical protein [Streptomyces sp. NPDC002057]|uniref:hypothetical protein n=1 Tax=Streptomyces sp. NPDC002057 TaxID=3154664 RepID=UPI00332C0A41
MGEIRSQGRQGIDVTRVLTDAHAAGTGVNQAIAAVTTAATQASPRPGSAPRPGGDLHPGPGRPGGHQHPHPRAA